MKEDLTIGAIMILVGGMAFFGLTRTESNREEYNRRMLPIVEKVMPQEYQYCTMPTAIYVLSDTAFIDRTGLFHVGDTLFFDADYQQFKNLKHEINF
jgi:hypothetical protein